MTHNSNCFLRQRCNIKHSNILNKDQFPLKRILVMLSVCLLISVTTAWASNQANLVIPKPLKTERHAGHFTLRANTVIVRPETLKSEAAYLGEILAPATGFKLSAQVHNASGQSITLSLDPGREDLGPEGYRLEVTPDAVQIKAPAAAGVFYGIQSLLQLLPPDIVSSKKISADWTVPCVSITDKPRFSWRAFHLDEARHFKGEAVVKKMLDQMAVLKMNVFHWYLTDDQGWRIEIKKYPKLTEIGSRRKGTQTGGWRGPISNVPHAGFYTQEQVKEIVAYAKARHITILPQISMPGHASAAIASYPWLGTKNEEIEVATRFGTHDATYNPASARVYETMSDIFDELFTLFPSPIIHIGGDEVRFNHWKESGEVKALMERENLATMADVQIYFTNRIAKIVESKGRHIMGWNEVLGDDLHGFLKDGQTAKAAELTPDTVIHFWKGNPELAKRAIRKGHRVVNSLHSSTYLDYSYGSISLHRAYLFDPLFSGLTEDEQKQVLGSGCQMWGEWIPTVERMEYQVFPRIAAYAEGGWTARENKDYDAFETCLQSLAKRWKLQGIAYAKRQLVEVRGSRLACYATVDIWDRGEVTYESKDIGFSTGTTVTQADTYEVVFICKMGRRISLHDVALLQDGKPVAVDKHSVSLKDGRLEGDLRYELKLPTFKRGATYTLRAHMTRDRRKGTDSQGEVKMRLVPQP